MEEITYVYIDGGYLKTEYQNTVRKLFGNQFDMDYSKIKHMANARRVFYYDCIDDIQKPNEDEDDLRARIQRQEEYLDSIDALDGFHVRRGHLARGRNKQQKEVDVLLAVDMMNHAFGRNMTRAVLISGDRDFRPVVESVTGTGTYVEVMYRKKSGSKNLGRAADLVSHLGFATLINWTAATPGESIFAYLPNIYGQSCSTRSALLNFTDPTWRHLKEGTVGSPAGARQVRAYRSAHDDRYLITLDVGTLTLSMHTFKDLAKLEQLIDFEYGPITWAGEPGAG
jgi:uncharacterized LabA/DUF88 family protein